MIFFLFVLILSSVQSCIPFPNSKFGSSPALSIIQISSSCIVHKDLKFGLLIIQIPNIIYQHFSIYMGEA